MELRKRSAPERTLAQEIGNRLRAARESRGWQQAEVAERIGVPVETYGSWERGYRLMTTDKLPVVASVFGRPIWYFFGAPDPSRLSDQERILLDLYRSLRSDRLREALIMHARSFREAEEELGCGTETE